MSIFKLFTGGVGATVQAISRGVATFTGDKVQREANVHSEQQSVLDAYASENAQIRENRTWWDSFADGLNRLPRPLLAAEVIALPHWAVFDPVGFAAAMQSLALTPEWLAILMGQVILLFCGGRMLDKWPGRLKGPSAAQVQAVLDIQRQIQGLGPAAAGPSPSITPEQYDEEIRDESKPLSDAAIAEWNARAGD